MKENKILVKFDTASILTESNYNKSNLENEYLEEAIQPSNVEAADKAEVVIPSSDMYNELDKILQPMIERIIENRVENRKLSSLRDTLLPKLMNGEIEVEL